MSSSLSQRFPKLLSSSMWEEINHIYCIPSVLSLLLGMYLHYCYISSLALCPSGISVRLAPSAGRFCPTENFVVNDQNNSEKAKEVLQRNKLFLEQLRVVPWDKFRSGFVTVLHKVSPPTGLLTSGCAYCTPTLDSYFPSTLQYLIQKWSEADEGKNDKATGNYHMGTPKLPT